MGALELRLQGAATEELGAASLSRGESGAAVSAETHAVRGSGESAAGVKGVSVTHGLPTESHAGSIGQHGPELQESIRQHAHGTNNDLTPPSTQQSPMCYMGSTYYMRHYMVHYISALYRIALHYITTTTLRRTTPHYMLYLLQVHYNRGPETYTSGYPLTVKDAIHPEGQPHGLH